MTKFKFLVKIILNYENDHILLHLLNFFNIFFLKLRIFGKKYL